MVSLICGRSRGLTSPFSLDKVVSATMLIVAHRFASGLSLRVIARGFRYPLDSSVLQELSNVDVVVVASPLVSVKNLGTTRLRELHLDVETLELRWFTAGRQTKSGHMSCGTSNQPRICVGDGDPEDASKVLPGILSAIAKPCCPCGGAGQHVLAKQQRYGDDAGFAQSAHGTHVLGW